MGAAPPGARAMPSQILTLDLGNSRCKLCTWQVAEAAAPMCLRQGILEGATQLAERVGAWLAKAPVPDRAVLSSVGCPALEAEVAREVEARVGALTARPAPGIENRCRHPETTGADRLYAGRGALETVGRAAIVVDAGTALTVDAVGLDDAGGREFLGGAIAPGPTLSARALEAGAARLPFVEPRPGTPALGRETEEAIRAGVVVGFRGAARALVEEIAREAGFDDAPVVLSGGARRFLLEPRPFVTGELVEVADLVHLGLLHAGLDAAGATP